MKGIVKWFDDEKGYGFIECNGEDIFVHFTTIREEGHKSLVQGEYVNFEIVNTIKGKRTKNVISDKENEAA